MVREMIGGCCVCLDERGWNENPLVYCDGSGCNVAVHQACYGIVKVPSGPWFCCKCRSQERVARVKCELCPNKDGALKRTDTGGWAHVVCALYIPEVRFGDVGTMEPIIFSSIPHDRFMKACFICEENGRESRSVNGACMSCHKTGCKLSFHVTCAQSRRQLCEEASVNGHVQYVGYCSQHWPRRFNKQAPKDKDISTNSSDLLDEKKNPSGNKRGRVRTDSTSSTNSVDVQQKSTRGRKPKQIDTSPDSKAKDKSEDVSPVKGNNEGKRKDEDSGGKSKSSSSQSKHIDHNANSYGSMSNEKIKGSSPLNTPVPVFHKNDKTDEESSGSSVVNNAEIISKRLEAKKRKLENEKEKEKIKKKQKLKVDIVENGKKKKLKVVESKKKNIIKEKEKNGDKKNKIPIPSKLGLVENGKVSSWDSVLPQNEETPDNFQDFLEHQWNESAHFIMSKAEHFDVASLLNCLHQLKADNLKLEKKLAQIQARRDRLLGVNARLAKSFTDNSHEDNNDNHIPLSAMLSKLNDNSSSKSSPPSTDFEIKESPETKELKKKRSVASPDLAMLAAASLKFESEREGREDRETSNERTIFDSELQSGERPPDLNDEPSISSLLIQPTVSHHKSNSLLNSSYNRMRKDQLNHANFFGDSIGQSSSKS